MLTFLYSSSTINTSTKYKLNSSIETFPRACEQRRKFPFPFMDQTTGFQTLRWQHDNGCHLRACTTSTSEKSSEIDIDEVKRIVEKELARSAPEVTHSLLNKVKSASNFDFDRFSTKLKLVRATAFVLRFVHNLKCLTRKKDIPREHELEAQELIAAEQATLFECYRWNILHKSFAICQVSTLIMYLHMSNNLTCLWTNMAYSVANRDFKTLTKTP